MYDGHAIGVVIPAYNEEGFIGDVIDDLPEFVDRAYVVDDASTDRTWEEIRHHVMAANQTSPPTKQPSPLMPITDGGSAYGRRIVPMRHQTNGGRGAAIKTGYRQALVDEMDLIAVIDGDGQHDPTILDRFLDPLVEGRADYAKGNRLLSPSHRERMSKWRLFGNTVLTYLTKIASGYWRMMDPQNGYTVISVRALKSIDLDALYDDYGFLNDILVKLNVADVRIIDVAMEAKYGDEESGIRYTTFIPKLSGLLLRNFIWRLRTKYLLFDFHPLVGLYVLGALGLVGGAVLFGWTLGTGFTVQHAVSVFVLFLVSGLLITLAMIFDRATNIRLEDRIEDHIEGGAQ